MSVELIQPEDLELALGTRIYNAAFDDAGQNSANLEAVVACIQRASADVESYLLENYPDYVTPDPVHDLLKSACIGFCRIEAAQRAPEMFAAVSAEKWTEFEKSIVAKMERYRKSVQRLPDATAGHPEVVDEGPSIVTTTSRWNTAV